MHTESKRSQAHAQARHTYNNDTVSMLTRKAGGALSHVDYRGWREVEITVDSGACDTVMPTFEHEHITLHESEGKRNKLEYEVANGESISNDGERRCLLMTQGAKQARRITFQCADVHKALLSVTRCADIGYDCVPKKWGGYLEDSRTKERVPIRRKGNLYIIQAWIKEDFQRQGS